MQIARPSVSPVEVIVRPRVVTADGTSMLLTDALEPWLSRSRALIQLGGSAGSGKSTALRYLSQQPEFSRWRFLDGSGFAALADQSAQGCFLYVAPPQLNGSDYPPWLMGSCHRRLQLARLGCCRSCDGVAAARAVQAAGGDVVAPGH